MPRIKQVRVNGMLKAIALDDFVNWATGITIKKFTESGLYDEIGTISDEPSDTSWLFEGSTVRKTRLFDGSAVKGNSCLEFCVLRFANVDCVEGKDVNFRKGECKNSKVEHCMLDNCNIEMSNIYANRENVMISNLDARNVNIQVSLSAIEYCSMYNCNVTGEKINITNSNVAQVNIYRRTEISDSTITINELRRDEFFSDFFKFDTSDRPLCILGAYITNAKDIRIINVGNKNLCVYLRKKQGECSDVYIGKEGGINSIFQSIKTFSQEGEGLLYKWSRETENVNKFLDFEFNLICGTIPVLPKDEQTLKNILVRDIFEILFSNEKEIIRTKFINSFSIDILSKEVSSPENFLFISDRLFDYLKETFGIFDTCAAVEKIGNSNKTYWI